ncbi:MAG: hypothetical protein IAE89_12145 [Anaerolineae bacterium]|nr:hypothetical protein [Anaerolineae bacterium]
MQKWLHQQLFKVGWLVSKRLSSTTVIYYMIFFPGILLYELSVWFAATLLNVRADFAFKIPEEQSAAELKLDFIKLGKNTSVIKLALLAMAPIAVGILIIWILASSVLAIPSTVAPLTTTGLEALPEILQRLTATPNFWLWTYVIFAIANTMFPSDLKVLRGWPGMLLLLIPVAVTVLLSAASSVMGDLIAAQLGQTLASFNEVLIVVIGIDILMTVFLRIVEAVVERVTGDSATFEKGKLVTLTRAQVQQTRTQKREKQAKAEQARANAYHSIYDLPFPLPSVTGAGQAAARHEPAARLGEPTPLAGRAGASMITAEPLRIEATPIEDEEGEEFE